jgi:uridine kinase
MSDVNQAGERLLSRLGSRESGMSDLDGHRPLVVGVAGGTGAGKTTVARAIIEAVGHEHVAEIPEDAYYREYQHVPESERAAINWDHPDTIEVTLLLEQLRELMAGNPIERPVYDFAAYARAPQTITVPPRPVLIVEGILLFVEPRLRDLFDVKVFVDTDADLRFIRRLLRDVRDRGRTVESVVSQYVSTVRPMHIAFVEPSKRYADIIVPEGGENHVAIALIRSAILHSVQPE